MPMFAVKLQRKLANWSNKAPHAVSTHATLRIFPDEGMHDINISRERFRLGVTSLTLFISGSRASGSIIADVLRRCYEINELCLTAESSSDSETVSLRRLTIERRDNDWDAPATHFHLLDEESVGDALCRYCSNLETFSLEGLVSPIENICTALGKLTCLCSLSLKADTHYGRRSSAVPLITPDNLKALLQKGRIRHRLCLVSVIPETAAFKTHLHDAMVCEGSRIHLFVYFQQQQQPSSFSYFLRQVMETNQLGRMDQPLSRESVKGLLKHIRKRSTSLDSLFLILRENPWLCRRQVAGESRIPKWRRSRLGRLLNRSNKGSS